MHRNLTVLVRIQLVEPARQPFRQITRSLLKLGHHREQLFTCQFTITVNIERAETDPEEVIEGEMQGRFRAPLVDERVAERNLSLLIVDDILGLPLSSVAGDAGGA